MVTQRERERDGGESIVSVERDSIDSRHPSVVGLQCYRYYHEQMDLSGVVFHICESEILLNGCLVLLFSWVVLFDLHS